MVSNNQIFSVEKISKLFFMMGMSLYFDNQLFNVIIILKYCDELREILN